MRRVDTVAVTLALRVVDILARLSRASGWDVPVILVEVAGRAAEFDNVIDPLERQVECPATQPGQSTRGPSSGSACWIAACNG